MSKYHNKKVEYDNIKFDSLKERDYYIDLCLMEKEGEINDFLVHPREILIEGAPYKTRDQFGRIVEKKSRKMTYAPDFIVFHDGFTEFIEIKGGNATKTQAWNLKWKMLIKKYEGVPGYVFTIID